MTSHETIEDINGHIVVSLGDSRVSVSNDEDHPRELDHSPSSSSAAVEAQTSEQDEITSVDGEEEPLVSSVEQGEDDNSRQVSYFGGIWNAFRSKFSSSPHDDSETNNNESIEEENRRKWRAGSDWAHGYRTGWRGGGSYNVWGQRSAGVPYLFGAIDATRLFIR